MPSYTPGTRNTEAQFETASHQVDGLDTNLRPDAISFDPLIAYSMGPEELGNADEGAYVRAWRARADNTTKQVFVARANEANDGWEAEVELFNFIGVDIVELDLAFEQAGRAFIAAERADGHVWFYWYDPTLLPPDFTFQDFGPGRTPRCLLDNPADTTDSDILAFYIVDGNGIVYRHQRDRYDEERATPWLEWENLYLEEAARSADNRVVLILSTRDTGAATYELSRRETTLYPFFIREDELEITVASIVGGSLASAVIEYDDEDEYDIDFDIVSGILAAILIEYTEPPDEEDMDIELDIASGTLVVVVIEYSEPPDEEDMDITLALQSGLLVLVIIDHVVYDPDELDITLDIAAGGSLVTV